MPVTCFTTAHGLALDGNDAVFVDDEGLLKPCDRFFAIRGMQPLAGKGLILGADKEGDTQSAKTSIVGLRRQTFFLERRESTLEMTRTPWLPNLNR